MQESVSCSIIDEVLYGLKSFHDLAGQPDPTIRQLLFNYWNLLKGSSVFRLRRKNRSLPRLSSAWLLFTVPLLLV